MKHRRSDAATLLSLVAYPKGILKASPPWGHMKDFKNLTQHLLNDIVIQSRLWFPVPFYEFEIDLKYVNHLFACKPSKWGK